MEPYPILKFQEVIFKGQQKHTVSLTQKFKNTQHTLKK